MQSLLVSMYIKRKRVPIGYYAIERPFVFEKVVTYVAKKSECNVRTISHLLSETFTPH